jgi:predicted alpha/beta hydrolase family esterase
MSRAAPGAVSHCPVPPPVLVLPGWTSSGPEHWQSRWEHEHPGWRRVEQADWEHPEPVAWLATLDAAVAEAQRSTGRAPILVAHSLGALLVAAWVESRPAGVAAAGALLVAPPDVEHPDTPPELTPFAPMPRARLPFPSVLAASRDDPYLSWARAEVFAAAWGATLHDCGLAGHINAASGHGPWPEGERLLAALLARVD